MVIFQYNLYIFGIHLRTVLYSKPRYNEPCYNEVEVYIESSVKEKYEKKIDVTTGISYLVVLSWYPSDSWFCHLLVISVQYSMCVVQFYNQWHWQFAVDFHCYGSC